MRSDTLLDVRELSKDFVLRKGVSGRQIGTIRAVDRVSFSLSRGETLGLVGESGCGKTTTGRSIIRAVEPTSGSVWFTARNSDHPVDLAGVGRDAMADVWRRIRLIFQDPYSSLNPRMNVYDILSAPFRRLRPRPGRSEMEDRVVRLLGSVGLNPDHMRRYPHAFSGGQRQRIAIARALVTEPELVIADEPVSALDVSVQAQVLRLLEGLKHEFNLTFIFVAHNLSVVEYMCDRIAVMYMGRIVELCTTRELYHRPLHPYSITLLSAIPVLDPRKRRTTTAVRGEVGDLISPPSGCHFHPRCSFADDRCRVEVPQLRAGTHTDYAGGEDAPHLVACHHAGQLELKTESARADGVPENGIGRNDGL